MPEQPLSVSQRMKKREGECEGESVSKGKRGCTELCLGACVRCGRWTNPLKTQLQLSPSPSSQLSKTQTRLLYFPDPIILNIRRHRSRRRSSRKRDRGGEVGKLTNKIQQGLASNAKVTAAAALVRWAVYVLRFMKLREIKDEIDNIREKFVYEIQSKIKRLTMSAQTAHTALMNGSTMEW